MNEKKKMPKWLVWTLIALAVLGLVALYFWLKATGRLGIFESPEAVQAWLEQFGVWAWAIFLLLQVAQVVVAFIPGEVTSVAAGVLFGFWEGTVLNVLGIALGSALAFALARRFGRPAVEKLAGREVLDKYMDTVNRHSGWLLFSMFLLPFFPKDALCYVAGLTGIAWPMFLVLATFARMPGQVMSALVGSGMVVMPWWGWALIALGAAGLVYLSFRYAERINGWIMGVLKKKL